MTFVRISGLFLSVFIICYANEEPMCLSRYDYDHKVMTSLVTLETVLNSLRGLVNDHKDEIALLHTKLAELQKASSAGINSLSRDIKTFQSAMSLEGSGSTYIRWGRTSCPDNGTELVYEGYAAGADYSEPGAPAEYICLPKDPIWDYYEEGHQGGTSVRGAEYEFGSRNVPNFFERDLLQNDVPCAVCRTKRPSVLMIPGRNQCYDGWAHEYSGYLSGGHSSHPAASEFVCMDRTPEVIPGGIDNHNGKLFYFAEVYCGSLKCPPYVQGRELTCVVCSK